MGILKYQRYIIILGEYLEMSKPLKICPGWGWGSHPIRMGVEQTICIRCQRKKEMSKK